MPKGYVTSDGYTLDSWKSEQRKRKDKLPPLRKARLEALADWSWDPFSDLWEEGFRHLQEFAEREGHLSVTKRYISPDGYLLGSWISNQRTKKDKILPERKARLEALPGWVWLVKEK
jgi:hypothetical protein